MVDPWYLVGVLVIAFVITFALRALPFAFLKPLRESRFVKLMSVWMPAGVLVILAAMTLRSAMGVSFGHLPHALIAVAVTIVVHLLAGRRTLLSVGVGTLSYVVLLAVW